MTTNKIKPLTERTIQMRLKKAKPIVDRAVVIKEEITTLKKRIAELESELAVVNVEIVKVMPIGQTIKTESFTVRHDPGKTFYKWACNANAKRIMQNRLVAQGFMVVVATDSHLVYTQPKIKNLKKAVEAVFELDG